MGNGFTQAQPSPQIGSESQLPVIEVARHQQWGMTGSGRLYPIHQAIELTRSPGRKEPEMHHIEMQNIRAKVQKHVKSGAFLQCVV